MFTVVDISVLKVKYVRGAPERSGVDKNMSNMTTYRPLGYERVYLPLCRVADTPFHIQGDDMWFLY